MLSTVLVLHNAVRPARGLFSGKNNKIANMPHNVHQESSMQLPRNPIRMKCVMWFLHSLRRAARHYNEKIQMNCSSKNSTYGKRNLRNRSDNLPQYCIKHRTSDFALIELIA